MNEFEKIDVLDLLPQRPPFVMIDRMVFCDMQSADTRFEVRADNLFVDDGHFLTEGMNENIAQTCAAALGYASLCRNEKVKIGFIGAVSGFKAYRTPVVGDVLETHVEKIQEVFNLTLVHAVVKVAGEVVAETDMKIALEN